MSTNDSVNEFRGLPLRLARTARRLSQADLAHQSGVMKWRVVEAELDRLTLQPRETAAIEKVLTGSSVQKAMLAHTASDEAIQKAFDSLEATLATNPDDQQRSQLAAAVIRLRKSLGLDAIKFVK